MRVNPEDILLRIESLATPYYYGIWNTFSRDEKLIIHDLARDQFANLKNIQTVTDLLQKGIFRFDPCGSLQLMNKSFNNFVLEAVREDEEMMMENEMRKRGTWNSLKVVIILVALGILLFLSVGQQSMITNLNTIITALAGLGGLLLKFGGFFDSPAKGSGNK